jgi:hypothetical protein
MSMPPQSPPAYGYNYQRTSGAAITSLVLGILLCIPVLSGILAIIFGIVGISSTRNPAVRGRGMAIAGLILGIANIPLWAFAGYGVYRFYVDTQPGRMVARTFLMDVSNGDITDAMNNSEGFTADQLKDTNKRLSQFGQLQDVTFLSFQINETNGVTHFHFGGRATFSGGANQCSVEMIRNTNTFKVIAYRITTDIGNGQETNQTPFGP